MVGENVPSIPIEHLFQKQFIIIIMRNIKLLNSMEGGHVEVKTEPMEATNENEVTIKSENCFESDEYGTVQNESICQENFKEEPFEIQLEYYAICEICSESFNSEIDLINHRNNGFCCREEKDFIIDVPELIPLRENDGLVKDDYIHAEEKQTHCNICLKPFTRKCGLAWHQMTHSGKKPYPCESCSKSFIQKCDLLRHQTSHTGEKPFQCKVCSKAFSLKYNLIGHERIHTGIKLFFCDICSKSFTKKFDLARHEMMHTGDKPFQCKVCSKRFARNYNLARHEKTHSG